jgi:HAE1 family hydrophobic/amphiphilic exporter-1
MTVLGRVADEARRLPGVTDTLATAYGGPDSAADGSIYVRLAAIEDRDLSQTDLMARARDLLARFPNELRTSVGQVDSALAGVREGHDAQYVIRGPDLKKLTGYSEELLKRLKAIPFVVDADTSVARRHEMRAVIDRRRAADLGASVSDIAQALNILGAGQRVSSFSFSGAGGSGAGDGVEECDVIARATERFRTGKEDLRTMTVPSANGGVINLDQVVRIVESAVPSSIDRLNRQRYVTLSANVESGGSQSEIISSFDKIAREIKLAPGYTVERDGKSKELGRTGYYFALAIALSFIFLGLVLAAHFNSFIQPAAVLLTLPIVVPFGLLSLLGSGQTINTFSGLWLPPIFGLVVRNAILQFDGVKRLRAAGAPRNGAIIQASRARLRPFLMTIMAMGVFLALFVIPTGAVTMSASTISILVAVGLSLCMTLTPFACLAFYSLFEDFVESEAWRRAGEGYNRIKTGLRRRLGEYEITNRLRSRRRGT